MRLRLAPIVFLIAYSERDRVAVKVEALYVLQTLLYHDVLGAIDQVEEEAGINAVEQLFCSLLTAPEPEIVMYVFLPHPCSLPVSFIRASFACTPDVPRVASQLIARAARKRRRQFIEADAPRMFCKVLKTTMLPQVALYLLVAMEVFTRDTTVQVQVGRPLIPQLLFFIQEETSIETAATAVRVLQNLMTNQVGLLARGCCCWGVAH